MMTWQVYAEIDVLDNDTRTSCVFDVAATYMLLYSSHSTYKGLLAQSYEALTEEANGEAFNETHLLDADDVIYAQLEPMTPYFLPLSPIFATCHR